MGRRGVQDGVALATAGDQSGIAQHRQVLAHVGDLAADPLAEIRHGQLADGERFEDTQPLGVREGPTDRRIAFAVRFGGDWQAIQHVCDRIIICANTQTLAPAAIYRKNGGEVST